MEHTTLYLKFLKGVSYFKDEWIKQNDNPSVRRQLSHFEREVIQPFDAACLKLSDKERQDLEDLI